MNSLLSGMQNVSKPVAGLVAVLSVTSLVGLLRMFGGTGVAVVVAGLVFVGLLLLLYKQVLKLLAKRKAAPLTKELSSAAGAAPQGISDPARRARLDDLRKSFENGVEKFRAAGKNLYSLPWYLLVGEPGSGKTEAIRHCNVGFPPGLQDQLQGAGGTINMNWWFTNHAVILDTAGRLMFEEVEPGSSNEWQEFLKLLRKHRPNCPVNGMMLVIPAESLIRDTADALERKGGKIAQQLDQIQRALGVRFPVFVVITKCDLINGFREFFEDLKDPQLQHQILGWSNPAPLDEPFNPEQIDKHLETVQRRLIRRRLGLMLDPVHTEDPTARRTDQVDALFAFPEAMMKIAPRLRRYLEMIFVAGAWSAKPLFLRGIYFTSSMREGSALDAELAEALGMPVESLPEGRVWERDRAYFLRDLFMSKVFREKGLVTRAVNTKAQQRQRRAMVLGAGGVGAVVLTAFTYLGYSGLKRDVVQPREFWERTREAYVENAHENFRDGALDYYQPIIYRDLATDEDFKYRGGVKEPFEDFSEVDADVRRIARFPEWVQRNAEARLPVPWVFYPVAAVTGNASADLMRAERRNAARVLVEASVVRPLVDAAAGRLETDARKGAWSQQASDALVQIVRLEAARRTGRRPSPAVQVEPLLAYATLGNDSLKGQSPKDIAALQAVVDWLYAENGGGAEVPPAGVAPLTQTARAGIDAFATSWRAGGPTPGGLSAVNRLVESFRAFEDAEAKLLTIDRRFTPADYAGATAEWRQQFAALRDAATRVEQDFAALKDRGLTTAYAEELAKHRAAAKSAHDLLLAELEAVRPAEGGGGGAADPRLESLRDLRGRVQGSLTRIMEDDAKGAELNAALAQLDALMVTKVGGEPAYKARFGAYTRVDERLWRDDGGNAVALGQFRERLERVNADLSEAETTNARGLAPLVSSAPGAATANPKLEEARRVCSAVLGLAGRHRRGVLVEQFLARAPAGADAMAERIGEYARENNLTLARPRLPLTQGESRPEFDPRFHPQAAAAVLRDGQIVETSLGTSADAPGVLRAEELRQRFGPVGDALEEYKRRYLRYWTEDQLKDLQVADMPWNDMATRLASINQAFNLNESLREIAKAMEEAHRRVDGVIARADLEPLRQMAMMGDRSARAEETSARTYELKLNSWRDLGRYDRVIDARQRLLQSVDRGEFALNYAVFEDRAAGGPGDFVLRFWEDLTYKLLRALALRAEQEARSTFESLRTTAGFPLRKLRADLPTMDVASVVTARSAVETVLAGAEGASRGMHPTGNERFNTAIEQLRGLSLMNDREREWMQRMRAVLAGLPVQGTEVLQCRITVLADRRPEAGLQALEWAFPNLDIVQGDAPPSPRLRARGGAGDATPVRYPGEPVKMFFYNSPEAAQPEMSVTFDGPWAAVRMVHEHGGRPASPDRKVWEVQQTVVRRIDGTETRLAVWLRLEFERPLPPLEEWPE